MLAFEQVHLSSKKKNDKLQNLLACTVATGTLVKENLFIRSHQQVKLVKENLSFIHMSK